MKLSAYLQGAIATALVDRDAWSVVRYQDDCETFTVHRCQIVTPVGVFHGDWCRDEGMAFRTAVAKVAGHYYRQMVAQRMLDRRRLAEDRMPDRRAMM